MTRYRHGDLVAFAAALFSRAGLPPDRATIVAEVLVEADLMGHDTHGLALAHRYLDELAGDRMAATGEPTVVSDHKAAAVWDGNRLSGVWLTVAAIDLASARAREFGMAAVTIRNSHHIACLAAYLTRATDRGQMLFIACSDPGVSTVAPCGGRDPVFSPDPFAVGIPTGADPILIDTSASITTNAMATRLNASGSRFPGRWALDAAGEPTDDPRVLFGSPRGALLPVGGRDHGHKGTALALLVEALSQGLSGCGRSAGPAGFGASVFVQVFEPAAFAGLAGFTRETDTIVARCHAARPAPGVDAVRLPGERALARRRAALADGLALFPGIMEGLAPHASQLGVGLPPGL